MHLGRRHGEGRPRQLLWLLLRPLLLLALRSLPGGVEKSVAEGGTHGRHQYHQSRTRPDPKHSEPDPNLFVCFVFVFVYN